MSTPPPERNGDDVADENVGHPPATGPGKGFRIGEYALDRILGHGSMANVYLAHDETGHEVALKLFQEGPGVSTTMLERFRREAEATKKLRRHPNIMKVYATGQYGIYHYIVMEPVLNSRTFDDAIADLHYTTENIVETVIKIARALHYAHGMSIVHRDVKPANIMVDEFDEPLLTDFGVAALIDWPTCTITGALTGTPLYMSPEQAKGLPVGPESDVYSLAVVLYEALAGTFPYSTRHALPVKNVLETVKSEAPQPLRTHRRDLSPDLEAVVMTALKKDPEERYPDAESFAQDLERAMAGRHVKAPLLGVIERCSAWYHRHKRPVLVVLALVVVMTLIVMFFRDQVTALRYQHLVEQAQHRALLLRVAGGGTDEETRGGAGPWPEIRQARRAIADGRWEDAVRRLDDAAALATGEDAAAARSLIDLEMGRAKTLAGRYDAAREAYQAVLDNPDAPAALGHQAVFELLVAALLHDRRQEAIQLLASPHAGPDNPFRDAVLCLTGEIAPEQFRARLPGLPDRLRNDARLAVAIRYRMADRKDAYRDELELLLRESTPAWEWPAPLARRLLKEMDLP